VILLCLLLAAGAAEQGLALPRAGKDAEAAASLQVALRKEPRNATFANELGFAYSRLGQAKDAEHYYRLAIDLQPSRVYAYANLADLLAAAPDRFDRADEALKLFERGLAAAPQKGRPSLAIHVADFERAAGRTAQAQARLAALTQLTADQRRRVRELQDRIADEERARALLDWPEPARSAAQEAALGRAEELLQSGDPRGALSAAEALSPELPAWRGPRRVRARALEMLGRADEEARELRVLTQLSPSDAFAWRRLGEILAQQGGFVETDRADEALRQALSLQPSWIELWLLRARVALRQGRAQDALKEMQRYALAGGHDVEAGRLEALAHAQPERSQVPSALPATREPSAQARALVAQASAPDVTPETARSLLQQALADSPAGIEAAAALVALGGVVPEATVQVLQNDGAGLLELAMRTRRSGASPAMIAPWVDRAVQLGVAEALLFRARLRTQPEEALQDLLAYTASREPQHLDEARALRALLESPRREDLAGLLARLRLNEDRPEAALAALGGKCDKTAGEARQLALGAVHEYAGELAAAVDCYRAAAPAAEALQRLARLGERVTLPQSAAELRAAEQQGVPQASWALARIDLDAGREALALPRLSHFIETASADDAGLPQARAARAGILQKANDAAQARLRKRAALASLGAALLLAVLAFFWSGSTVEATLRRAPRVFPSVARAVGEVRHDILKHRASALSMVAEPGARREDIARALLSPEPASRAVLRQYQALQKAALAQGVRLRRAAREPVFGPLLRDLIRAEKLLESGSNAELLQLDRRLRAEHTARLAALLKLGPRTRIDAGAVSGWIRDVEAEVRRGGAPWRAPSILLQKEVEFPVERGALQAIFANLLRNAQAATTGGEVIVRLGEERDAAGRNLTVLLVGDSAQGGVSLESIERRESGRGLALVRDLTREWQGHLVVRAEEPPWKKAVGACFPAPPA
jgi:tetratricopeptide (TPR) repeat protein